MGKKSSEKGATYERQLAQRISLWWSEGQDKYIFARRSGSGGALRDLSGNSGSGGDIFADKPDGERLMNNFTFEAKFYRDLTPDLWNFMASDSKKLSDFIDQAEEAAIPLNTAWGLIMKTNRKKEIFMTNHPLFLDMYTPRTIFTAPNGIHILPFAQFLVPPIRKILQEHSWHLNVLPKRQGQAQSNEW